MEHDYKGPATGFVATKALYHFLDDTEGFVGYLPSDNSIYVVFRGSLSLSNFITDLNLDKVKYKTRPDCDCQVHEGFYNATLSVWDDVLAEVHRLKALYPAY